MPDVAGLRAYSHAHNETDDVLYLFLTAAMEWLSNAGVPHGMNSPLYTLAVYMLATHWMDNRGVVSDTPGTAEVPLGVMSIMHQLRNTPYMEVFQS